METMQVNMESLIAELNSRSRELSAEEARNLATRFTVVSVSDYALSEPNPDGQRSVFYTGSFRLPNRSVPISRAFYGRLIRGTVVFAIERDVLKALVGQDVSELFELRHYDIEPQEIGGRVITRRAFLALKNEDASECARSQGARLASSTEETMSDEEANSLLAEIASDEA